MNIVNYCVICNSKDLKSSPARMHKFVVDRMTNAPIGPNGFLNCALLNCNNCDFMGTNVRFTTEEEMRFYRNYMKDEYINHRCTYDGEFIRGILQSFNTDDYKITRRNKISQVLPKTLNLSTINSVLDYGGDTGFIIPTELNHAKKYLLDVDVRENNNEVISITSADESGPIDLIICSHVLEHVSFPLTMIDHIKTFMNNNSYLYLEVPKEPFTEPGVHEHINRFNDNNLRYILEHSGFEIMIMEDLKYEKYVDSAFYALCKLK